MIPLQMLPNLYPHLVSLLPLSLTALLPSPEAGMIWGPFLADALNSRSTLRTVPLLLLT